MNHHVFKYVTDTAHIHDWSEKIMHHLANKHKHCSPHLPFTLRSWRMKQDFCSEGLWATTFREK